MTFLMDIWHAIQGIVTTSGLLTLIVMAVIAIGAGALMSGMGSVVTTTLIALIAFALVEYVLAITMGKQNAGAFAMADWQAFQNLKMLTLLAYALLFGVVIAVAHTARTLITR
jgi:hypothetical protein